MLNQNDKNRRSSSNLFNRFLNHSSSSLLNSNNSNNLNNNTNENIISSNSNTIANIGFNNQATVANSSSNTSNHHQSLFSQITSAAISTFHQKLNPQMDFFNINSNASSSCSSNSSSTASSLTSMPSAAFKLERKHFEKLTKLAEKILKYCQSDKMNLINSPPYIIDILPDICQSFNMILLAYDGRLHVLNDIEYFNILIRNLLEKFQQLIELFKLAGKRMYEENSEERKRLIKFTLTFSHILAEMKSIFPKDVYEGQNFRIAKKDASEFWKFNFGEKIIVGWREFEFKLNKVHKISNESEVIRLRETIQLTRTRYVSIFEFDIFTRLFQPWNNLLDNWKFLVTEHPGYSAFSTYDEIHKRLQTHINKPGSYLFRLSCTKLGQWAIGYVTNDRKILQTIPQSLVQALIDGQQQGLYVYPDGRDIKIDISSAIAVTSASRIQISSEQFNMYLDMGTTFQVCKICAENNKDRKLEPCGHLICSRCLENWQEKQNVPSCPFCRSEIKTFEPIIISPFESNKKSSEELIDNVILRNENRSVLNEIDTNSPMNNGLLGKSDHEPMQFQQTPDRNNCNIGASSSIDHLGMTNSISKLSSTSNLSRQPMSISNEGSSDDEYLMPKHIETNQDESKFNVDSLIGSSSMPKSTLMSNLPGSSNDFVLQSLPVSLPQSNSLPPPPQIPPPPPPLQGSILSSNHHQSNSAAPLLPPPPPPISTVPKFPIESNPSIITASSTQMRHTITLNIDNDNLFEQFLSKYGKDRVKSACALFLANNDSKLARSILSFSKNRNIN